MRRRGFSKARAKRIAKECLFCGESDLKLLDTHRIVEGAEGGTYCERNTVTTCANCHRRVHAGRIVIQGKHFSTAGRWLVFYTEDGVAKVK